MALQNIPVEQRAPRRNDGYRKPPGDNPQAIAGDTGRPPQTGTRVSAPQCAPLSKRVRQTGAGPQYRPRPLVAALGQRDGGARANSRQLCVPWSAEPQR
jgi:hypothetical protein